MYEKFDDARRSTVQEVNSAAGSFFSFDDATSMQFSLDEISTLMTNIEVQKLDVPSLLRQNSGFAFLSQKK